MSETDDDPWRDLRKRYRRLKKLVAIDKHDLDNALEQQPTLYLEASDLLGEVAGLRDHHKEKQSSRAAEIGIELRDTGEYKSEASIKEALEANDENYGMKVEVANWSKFTTQCYGLKDAFDQRGRALRELTHLYISGYYQSNAAGRRRLSDLEHEENRKQLAEARRAKRPS